MIFNKKFFIYSVIVFIVGILVGFLWNNKSITIPKAPEKQEIKQVKKEIKIAQMPLTLGTSFPLFVAQEEGFFDKYNLTVKFEQMNRSLSIQTLLAKSVDYAPFIEEGTAASLKGAPVKTIMVFADHPSFALIVRPGVKPEDIKRAALGQGTWGYYTALKLFKEMNISPEILIVPGLEETKAMLAAGSADATTMAVPTAFQLREQGYTIVDVFDKEALFGLVTTDEKIKNNPEEVEGVVKAIQAAIDFIQNDPEKTKELIFAFYKYEKNDVNNKIVDDTYAVGKKIFKNIKTPSQTAIKEMIQVQKTTKFDNLEAVSNQTVSPEDITNGFDFRFIK